ncbi:YheC/YheD family protein [Alteribacter populi]|uniref:YheC/YheD family endospore coat-associated protein n=1 Tax=Alteribacter populi TaxID=2011011 RepID=UPI000BBAB57A|nr:YheC/YheD family protein [Alteribacter populi]
MSDQTEEGIFFGVFLSANHKKVLKKKRSTHKRYSFFYTLAKEAALSDIHLFFFSPEDVDLQKRQIINGLQWNEKKDKWETALFPFPNVFYERIYLQNKQIDRIRATFKKLQIPSINALSSFDKLDVYKRLIKNKTVRHYLPPTKEVKTFEDVNRFLQTYHVIYLKKVLSSLGRGIVKVKETDNKIYEYSYFRSRLRAHHVTHPRQLKKPLNHFFRNKSYIAQKGIDLLEKENRSIDFRAEVQRTGEDHIEITGISARVGQKKSPITVHSIALPFEDFLRTELDYTNEQIIELKEKAETFLLAIYTALEDAYGRFGEMGIDFGIDKDENIWFIESNSKSAKVSFEKSYGKKGLQRNAQQLLNYADFLVKI